MEQLVIDHHPIVTYQKFQTSTTIICTIKDTSKAYKYQVKVYNIEGNVLNVSRSLKHQPVIDAPNTNEKQLTVKYGAIFPSGGSAIISLHLQMDNGQGENIKLSLDTRLRI